MWFMLICNYSEASKLIFQILGKKINHYMKYFQSWTQRYPLKSKINTFELPFTSGKKSGSVSNILAIFDDYNINYIISKREVLLAIHVHNFSELKSLANNIYKISTYTVRHGDEIGGGGGQVWDLHSTHFWCLIHIGHHCCDDLKVHSWGKIEMQRFCWTIS